MKLYQFSTILVLILISVTTKADWLCTESSSIKTGSTIISCGVAKASTLAESRKLALENAIQEFNNLCDISADCSRYDYNVVPQRTECSGNSGIITCYRAVNFEVTKELRKDAAINSDSLERNLKKTQDKADSLRLKLYQTYKLKEAQADVEEKNKQLSQLESTDAKLLSLSKEDRNSPNTFNFYSDKSKQNFKFGVSYSGAKLTSNSEFDMGLNIAYESKLTKNFGLEIEYAHGGDMKTVGNHTSGTPNTTQTFDGNMNYNSLSVGALVYTGIKKSYVKLEGGAIQGNRTLNTVTYSPMGTGTTSQTDTLSIVKSFYGVSLGLDSRDNNKGWGTYVEVGARTIDSKVSAVGTLGLSFGF